MSPEYNGVYVPFDKARYFEYVLNNIKGHFATKSTVLGEIPLSNEGELIARWAKETVPVRQLVAKFAQPQADPTVEAGINTGISRLVADSYDYAGNDLYFRPTEQQIAAHTALIRAALAGKFMDDLPEALPDYIRLLPTPKGNVLALSHNIGRARFSPREITFLVERYGLNTGLIKNYSEIAKNHGVSSGYVQSSMPKLFRKVHGFLQPRRVELFQLPDTP